MENNVKIEYLKRDYAEFINPILMSLGLPEEHPIKTKTIDEIEDDVSEILDIRNDERYERFDAMPEVRIVRSKLNFALYEMRQDGLIERNGIDAYHITKKGEELLFDRK